MINVNEWKKLINKKFGVKSPSIDELHSLYVGGFTMPTTIPPLRYNHNTNTVETKKSDSKKSANEWIWVEGYKGTDENMICRDYQFELGKQYDMDCEDDEIRECAKGFHLCKELKSVFNYYAVGANNRYFKVKALVRKSDFNSPFDWMHQDKLVAKSIILEEEVSEAEVLKAVRECGNSYLDEMSDDELKACRSIGVGNVVTNHMINVLIQDGYSNVMAEYLIKEEGRYIFKCAHALGSMSDMSMDTKIKLIFTRLSGCDDD